MLSSRRDPPFMDKAETSPVASIEEVALSLLSRMTLADKIRQMSGDGSLLRNGLGMACAYNTRPIPAGENPRLGIPGIRFTDGPRGVVMYHSTCFPVSMARGASWDVKLEERIGDAIGVEARSQGASFFGGVCVNLLRHPAWGRAQETYGEDPYHLGEMGVALTRGVQRHIMACAKHYALNSMENARFKVDVNVDERTLHEVYLPHFRRCVEEGVAAIMSAYNKVNGEQCGHHGHLLRDILKEEWGFRGFVISDFIYGIRDGKAAVMGGLDVEMPFTQHYGDRLQRLVEFGEVPEAVIDEAVLRILRQKTRFSRVGEPERYSHSAVSSEAHKALAREAAQKSIVLLRNVPMECTGKPLLPIDRAQIGRIALIGRLAAVPNTGDRGSSNVRPPHVVTPLEGLQAALDDVEIVFETGRRLRSARTSAQNADLVILVVGYTHQDEGEYVRVGWFSRGGDRKTLTLSKRDEKLIKVVAGSNPNTVVVMMGGSAVITEAWRERVPAILMAWYPGMEGGHALADILLGEVNPSAKLPCVFPRTDEQLPSFDRDADSIDYGYYHGYRLLDRNAEEPAFPFGFGLSYTTFSYENLKIHAAPPASSPAAFADGEGRVQICVDVTNRGPVPGEEISQLYVGYEGSQVDRPVKELKGFCRTWLEPGETRRVSFEVLPRQLAYYNVERRAWATESITIRVFVGSSSSPDDLLRGEFRLQGG